MKLFNQQPNIDGKIIRLRQEATNELELLEQSINYLTAIKLIAIRTIKNNHELTYKVKQIEKLYNRTFLIINDLAKGKKIIANLFEPIDSITNKKFFKAYKEITERLKNYTRLACIITDKTAKEFYHENQKQRSKHRKAHNSNFKINNIKFSIIYSPCLAFTKSQQELLGIQNNNNFTSSHSRERFEVGNTNMVRVKIKEDNHVILDTYSGPASRTPYKNYCNANHHQFLLLKAITVINQLEVIKTLAKKDINEAPDNPINITEQYTQIIRPTSVADDDYEKEQFEDSLFAISLMEK